jgi:formylglycine-generating enzyme required for sulfatase activity
VTLEPFFLSKFEMTQGQWQRTMGSNPSAGDKPDAVAKHSPDNPVNRVDWHDCRRAMVRNGLALPTEEHWEYAARTQTSATVWSTGNDPNSLQDHANVYDKATERVFANPFPKPPDFDIDDGHVVIAPVGSFKPNRWGLYDMHGNVFEACSNGPYTYGKPPNHPEEQQYFVIRGGSNKAVVFFARTAMRLNWPVGWKDSASGLRPLRTIDP